MLPPAFILQRGRKGRGVYVIAAPSIYITEGEEG